MKEKSLEERARELDRSYLDKVAESVKLNTRGKHLHRLDDSKIRCPLCRKRFEKMADLSKALNPREVFVCHGCKIGIDTRDPFVNNWELPGSAPIPCPRCDSPMRFFCTSTGYWRAECYGTLGTGKHGKRRCGASLAAAQPDRKASTNTVDLGTIDRPIAPGEMILPDEKIQ